MKKNYVEAVLVIDRSGSMSSIRQSTIDSINEFLESLRTNGMETKVTLIQFDDKYEVNADGTNASMIQNLNESTYVPRGMTALHDAIGKTVNTVGERLAKMKESERPEKVMFAIITDGIENASTEFDSVKIKEMVTHQQDKYNWNFVFIGANQDAVLTAKQFGIQADSAISFAANSIGLTNVNASLRNYTAAYYAGNDVVAFTAEDRLNAMKDSNNGGTSTAYTSGNITTNAPTLTTNA